MAQNSFAYFGFLLLSAVVYQLLPGRMRRFWLLLCSLFFYSVCSLHFLWLLLITTGLTYFIGLWIGRSEKKKPALFFGLCANFGVLGFFKYLGFFSSLANGLFRVFGLSPLRMPVLAVPLGISFYTFVCCGYLLDVFRGKRAPERNLMDFALFVSFFPAILSGPIERAGHLLPQFRNLRRATGEDVKFAVTRLITGLTKKVLLADTLAIAVNTAYAEPLRFSGLQLVVAAIAYALQIYFDFSAYSDIAVGSARLFGIRLLENFRTPYLAQSTGEFWRRWHISLSAWFRDYIYFPLGGSRKGTLRTFLNVLIVFALSGLWHGASGKFVVWGLLCGTYQVFGRLLFTIRQRLCDRLHIRREARWLVGVRVLFTFGLMCVAWIFFRAPSVSAALGILGRIITAAGACFPLRLTELGLSAPQLRVLACSMIVILTAEALEEPLQLRKRLINTVWLRYAIWVAMLIAVAVFGAYGVGYDPQEFVYFQF